MKIWIHTGGVQNGPYTKEQIAAMHLPPATPVWYEGLPQWIPACQAPELADIFGAPAAAEHSEERTAGNSVATVLVEETAEALPPRPATFLAWSIILTLCCCTPFSLAAVVTGALTTQRYNRGNYEGAQRMSNVTEWLVIISITLGIVGLPVSMLAMM